jgi:hypothetical protein
MAKKTKEEVKEVKKEEKKEEKTKLDPSLPLKKQREFL